MYIKGMNILYVHVTYNVTQPYLCIHKPANVIFVLKLIAIRGVPILFLPVNFREGH